MEKTKGENKMSNMSYCKFRNTYNDLSNCAEKWDEIPDEEMNKKELTARKKLINACCDIALDFGPEIEREFEEL